MKSIKTNLFVLAIILSAGGGLWLSVNWVRAQASEQVIQITAKKFEFSMPEIVLKKGVPVIIEVRSEDVVHGFNIPDFGVREDVVPGRVTRVRVLPDKSGTFTFRCDHFCGSFHEEMEGTLIVTD
ncbi:MAG: cytochrome c oxidase subunit II [Deltaproteobacteria bacterium]|nr:cytochrome c oxidase subunit II [Deltaproteobacteria bacterium]